MADPIIVPRRREDFFDERGDPTLRFIRWIELVTGQTNQTVVDVIDTGSEVTSSASRISRNGVNINSIELKEFEIINTTVGLTTSRNQILICKNSNPIEITLDTQAIEGDEVHIKRRNAKVNVLGSIDGVTNKVINIKNYSMHVVFDGLDWSEI